MRKSNNPSCGANTTDFWASNPRSIKYYVRRFIAENRDRFAGKIVIDTPAGSGMTAQFLQEAGATVRAFDLFPEYFQPRDMICERANVIHGLPVEAESADFVFCQEGIEHFSDQYRALREFNRTLKKHGTLLLTTPNYSNLHSRLSHFAFESECAGKKMPPNEIDSIWMVSDGGDEEIYLGHYFLLGIQRLRGLAKLAGFRIKQIYPTRISLTSLVLLPFAYPLLGYANWSTYRHYRRRFERNRNFARGSRPYPRERDQVFEELRKLNVNLSVLLDRTLFVEFEKEADLASVAASLPTQHQSFDVIP